MKLILFLIINYVIVFASQINALQKEAEVQVFGLSIEETSLSTKELYKKGLSLYKQQGKIMTKTLSNGQKFTYPDISSKQKALKYFLSAGNRGDVKSALLAIDLEYKIGYGKDKFKRINELANVLHKKGHLYGTYLLANDYKRGLSLKRDFKLAKLYYEIIVHECDKDKEKYQKQLNSVKNNFYDIIYNTAKANVKNLKDMSAIPQMNVDEIKKKQININLSKKIQDAIEKHNEKSLEKYLTPYN